MYSIFRNLALILISAKFFALLARKCRAPQVVGEIIAGLVIGPCLLNLVQPSDSIAIFAEIGVVLLMFTTGLGTNLQELMRAGPIATLIACVGVAVPLAGGTLLYSLFYGFSALGSPEFYRALFIGTIMTATSVSITVATLQELGKLKSFLGTTIVSAAVIDDVIGIVVLTCVLGASGGTDTSLVDVLLDTVLFFIAAIVIGLIIHKAMLWLDHRNPHTQRITIVSLAFCFAMAYIAEQYFGIARHHGRLHRGHRALLHRRCALHRAPCGHQRLYAVFARLLRQYRPEDRHQRPDAHHPAVQRLLRDRRPASPRSSAAVWPRSSAVSAGADSLKVGVGMMTRGEAGPDRGPEGPRRWAWWTPSTSPPSSCSSSCPLS